MKLLFLAALVATANSTPVLAQDVHAGHSGQASQAAIVAAPRRLNLDTPVAVIVADPAGKAVLDAAIPELATHEQYESFKQMGLQQLAGYAPDKLTPEVLAKIEAGLSAIK